MSRPRPSRESQRRFWGLIRAGCSVAVASADLGVSDRTGQLWMSKAGGMPPLSLAPGSGRHLTLEDREAIYLGLILYSTYADIARSIGRSTSTVTRELSTNRLYPRQRPAAPTGGRARVRGRPASRPNYSPSIAQQRFEARLARPKPSKIASCPRLAAEVKSRLKAHHSPEQISRRLVTDFPDDLELRVSHETIYQTLYVQGRGGLKRELTRHLRTGRTLRKPQRRPDRRLTRILDMVNISERPPEVEDRAVPGHWEGDLITGEQNKSAIGTLVERTTGFVLLLHLPHDHGAAAVQTAMIAAMSALPDTLRRTLTWDQGIEMANHIEIAKATDLDIYFCDPHSPWQRGSNENTNGLLRQYFPKSTDLSFWGPGFLDHVADELNNRPRKRLGWKTPAEALDQLLSNPPEHSPVATTA
jgi:IS30 family transposase